MAFTNSTDIEAALNRCSTMEEWENLTTSMEIPEDLIPIAYQRLLELSFQDISFEVSYHAFIPIY